MTRITKQDLHIFFWTHFKFLYYSLSNSSFLIHISMKYIFSNIPSFLINKKSKDPTLIGVPEDPSVQSYQTAPFVVHLTNWFLLENDQYRDCCWILVTAKPHWLNYLALFETRYASMDQKKKLSFSPESCSSHHIHRIVMNTTDESEKEHLNSQPDKINKQQQNLSKLLSVF